MPPRRRTPAPAPLDVESARQKLAEGKIVRVGVSKSAQFPDGATGRVRRIGDPTVDGDEFVQVELTLNGTRDVLPFNPSDLTPATRGRPPGPTVADAHGRASVGQSQRVLPTNQRDGSERRDLSDPRGGTGTPPATRHLSAVGRPVAAVPDPGDGIGTVGAAGGRTGPPGGVAASTSGALSAVPNRAAGGSAALGSTGQNDLGSPGRGDPGSPSEGLPASPTVTKPKPARGPKRNPVVAITVSSSDTEPSHWRIEAKVGARVVLRSGAVAPARVWELVQLLDNDTLVKAVGSILDEQRKAAQARAEALAAELAQVRAELAALPGGTGR